MMSKTSEVIYDVIVIGGGPGGLAAAKAAMEYGTWKEATGKEAAGEGHKRRMRVAVLERDDIPGGILNQCVHDGFGIVRYGEQLSGPEYGELEAAKVGAAGAEILIGRTVTEITPMRSDSTPAKKIGSRSDPGPQDGPEKTNSTGPTEEKREPATSAADPGPQDGSKKTNSPDSAEEKQDPATSDMDPGLQDEAARTDAPDGPRWFRVTAVSRQGRESLSARTVVLATGCRERTRGMLSIPGTRPAGIYTAGTAQNLINRRNLMVGRRVVILGSGDIGLIMARRLTLEGAKVLCVAEAMPKPSGLARNVRQCLFDYNIPLYLNTTVSNIFGKNRLEAVELTRAENLQAPECKAQTRETAKLTRAENLQAPECKEQTRETAKLTRAENLQAPECEEPTREDLAQAPGSRVREFSPGEVRHIECDTLILSVGLIPENEVAQTAGVALDPKTNGIITDPFLQTSVPGIFACGNARAVMDLADFVSQQGEIAGANAAAVAAVVATAPDETTAVAAVAATAPDETTAVATVAATAPDETTTVADRHPTTAHRTEEHGQIAPPFLQEWKQDLHNAARKGLPEENSVTCTLCPKGCQVQVLPATGVSKHSDLTSPAAPGGGVDSTSALKSYIDDARWTTKGNGCPRGEAFAIQEMTDPQRILTTTMRLRVERKRSAPSAGSAREVLLPVRSDRPVPLREMQRLARRLQQFVVVIPSRDSFAMQQDTPANAPETDGNNKLGADGSDTASIIVTKNSIHRGDILLRDLSENHVNIIAEQSVTE